MLSSRQQQEHESVDGFTHVIDLLAKECTFVDMNANDYRDEFICDSFIRELKSPAIRQRLLEDSGKRKESFDKARTLELSFKNSLAL